MAGGYNNRMGGRWTGYDQQSDYDWSRYGSNPYDQFNQQVGGWLGEIGNPLKLGYDPTGSSTGGLGKWGVHVARPDDPEVGQYMGHILGGQQSSLQDAVKRMAGAGIRRGGMNVAGGPALESSLTQQAMGTLAGGYADRFKQAMDYNKYYQGELASAQKNYMDNIYRTLGLQLQGIGRGADWGTLLQDKIANEYQQNLAWRRGATGRDRETVGWNQKQDQYSRSLYDPVAKAYGDATRLQQYSRGLGGGDWATQVNLALLAGRNLGATV